MSYTLKAWAGGPGAAGSHIGRPGAGFVIDKLPEDVVGEQMPTGTILIRDGRIPRSPERRKEAVIYARINPRQDQSAMHEQIESCRSFCVARGWIVTKIVREVAPGVGPQRIKLARLIQQGNAALGRCHAECSEPLRLSILRGSLAKHGVRIGRRRPLGRDRWRRRSARRPNRRHQYHLPSPLRSQTRKCACPDPEPRDSWDAIGLENAPSLRYVGCRAKAAMSLWRVSIPNFL